MRTLPEIWNLRTALTWPLRKTVFWAAKAIGALPHTTYGEVASMHEGPCQRCVGMAVVGPSMKVHQNYVSLDLEDCQ